MIGGPQCERERLWAAKNAELAQLERQDLVRQDLTIEPDIEKQVYEAELCRLRKENSVLKENIQRCLKELKAYQLKYPSAYTPTHPLSGEDLPPWVSSSDVNSPLFDAYDARIAELEDLVRQQTNQLESLQEQTEAIITENESLREGQLETLRLAAVNTKKDEKGGGVMGPLEAELMNELNERAEILMAENAVMIEQKTVLITELENFQNELNRSNDQVAELNHKLAATTKDMHSARKRAAQSEKDREDSAAQTMKYSEVLGRVEAELEDCKEQLAIWAQKGEVADSNMVEARKQLKALGAKMEEDSLGYMRRTKAAEDRVRELQAQLSQRTQELDVSAEVVRKLRREYQSTRQDAEGMLQVMSGLERQLSEYANREEEVERVGKQQKEKLEEALVARDQSAAREEQSRREMERLLEERKHLQLARQKDIDDAAEQARQVLGMQLRSAEANLQEAERRNAGLRVEAERAVRESRVYKEQLERFQRELEVQREVAGQTMKELEDKLCSLSVGREEEISRLKKTRETNQELRALVDKLRVTSETTRQQTDERDKQREKEIISLKTSLREEQRIKEEKLRQCAHELREMEQEKETACTLAAEAEKRREEESISQRRRILDLESLLHETQTAAEQENRRLNGLLRNEEETAFTAQNVLETRMKEEREACNKLTSRCRSLEEVIVGLQSEKESLQREGRGNRSRVTQLKDELREERKRLKEMAAKLASSYEAREEYARSTRRALAMSDTVDDFDDVLQERVSQTSPDSVQRRVSGDHVDLLDKTSQGNGSIKLYEGSAEVEELSSHHSDKEERESLDHENEDNNDLDMVMSEGDSASELKDDSQLGDRSDDDF